MMLRTLPLVFLATTAFAGGSDAGFAPGQRWSCLTDQGAEAFLLIEDIEGTAVSFSWGVVNPMTKEFISLCNKRDELSVEETREFCHLLGDEISDGHSRLESGCQTETPE